MSKTISELRECGRRIDGQRKGGGGGGGTKGEDFIWTVGVGSAYEALVGK